MKIIKCQQYDQTWWAWRRGRASASEAPRIITPKTRGLSAQARGYAYELIGDLYDPRYGFKEDYITASMKNGRIMEPESRRFYEFERGLEVEQVGICISECDRWAASPDGLVGDDGLLELKNPQHSTQVDYLVTNRVPEKYLPQLHFQLLVTGRKWADFMSRAAGLPPLLVRVEPDDYTEALRKCLEDFWTIYEGTRQLIAAMLDPVPATRKPFVTPF